MSTHKLDTSPITRTRVAAAGMLAGIALGWAIHIPSYTSAAPLPTPTPTHVYVPAVRSTWPEMHVTITVACPEEDSLEHDAALCHVLTVEPLR